MGNVSHTRPILPATAAGLPESALDVGEKGNPLHDIATASH